MGALDIGDGRDFDHNLLRRSTGCASKNLRGFQCRSLYHDDLRWSNPPGPRRFRASGDAGYRHLFKPQNRQKILGGSAQLDVPSNHPSKRRYPPYRIHIFCSVRGSGGGLQIFLRHRRNRDRPLRRALRDSRHRRKDGRNGRRAPEPNGSAQHLAIKCAKRPATLTS